MSTILDERKKQLEKLENFIVNTRTKISSIVSALGWSVASISNDVENMVVCPFNETHHVPERSLEKHLKDCQWKAEGYTKEDLPLSSPCLPAGDASSIKFDEHLQDSVIQNARQQNPTITLVHYRCYTRNGLDISFFISFANNAMSINISFNFY